MGVGSLVLGIVGLIISIIPILGLYACPHTIFAVITGAVGLRKLPNNLALGGLVLGLVGSSLAGYWFYGRHKLASKIDEGIRKDSRMEQPQSEQPRLVPTPAGQTTFSVCA